MSSQVHCHYPSFLLDLTCCQRKWKPAQDVPNNIITSYSQSFASNIYSYTYFISYKTNQNIYKHVYIYMCITVKYGFLWCHYTTKHSIVRCQSRVRSLIKQLTHTLRWSTCVPRYHRLGATHTHTNPINLKQSFKKKMNKWMNSIIIIMLWYHLLENKHLLGCWQHLSSKAWARIWAQLCYVNYWA